MTVLPALGTGSDPLVVSSNYRREVMVSFPEPLVPLSAAENAHKTDAVLSDKDLGIDFLLISGDEKHKPVARWQDQNKLLLTFPDNASCSTQYTLQLKPGTKYLGGAAASSEPVHFRCPPDTLHGHAFNDARGVGVMVCPDRYRNRESREFSPDTKLRFVFRRAREHFWSGDRYYVDCVEGVLEPAYLKQGIDGSSINYFQLRGKEVWSRLQQDKPLPGHVVVRPATTLDPDDNWHLLILAEEGEGFVAEDPVCDYIPQYPELGTGVEWQDEPGEGYRLNVRFSEPMKAADMPKIFERMQLASGTNVAVSAGKGRKKLQLEENTVSFRYVGILEPHTVESMSWIRNDADEVEEESRTLSYTPQHEARGFVVEVSSSAPVLLDVKLPADITSHLGVKVAGAHHHRISLTPAWPVIQPGRNIIVPRKGARTLRLPCANLNSVQVNAWKIPHDMTATAFLNSLSDAARVARLKLADDLFDSRSWRGLADDEHATESADDALSSARKAESRNLHRSRMVLKNATAFPACRVKVDGEGMLKSGEAVFKLDSATGAPTPGMYLLRFKPESNTRVRAALRQMERAEESLDATLDVVVQVTDLNVTMAEEAVLVNRYSDGRPVQEGTVSWVDEDEKIHQVSIRNGIAWLPEVRCTTKAWVRSGDDVVVVSLPSHYRGVDSSDPADMTMLVLDRPLYRPGDVVNVRGVLRRALQDGSSSLPEEKQARVSFFHPDGRELETRELPLGDFGAFETAFTMPTGEDDVAGEYEIRVESGDSRESVKANCQVFRRDAFMTSLAMDIDPVIPESFTLNVSAVDYSGTPLGGARGELVISGEKKEVTLDAEGKTTLTCPVTPEMRKEGCIIVSGHVVNDREEYVVLKELNQIIHPADFRIELRENRIKVLDSRTGEPLARPQLVQLQLVSSHEKPLPGPNGFGPQAAQDTVHWSGSLTIPANCTLGMPLPVKLDNEWRSRGEALVASGRDAAGREAKSRLHLRRYASGEDKAPELKATAQDGAVELLVDLPHAGFAHVLVGCGQKLRHMVLPVQEGKQTYRVSLKRGEEGKLSFALVLPVENAGDNPICSNTTCFVPVKQYHLDVELQLPQQICRPAEKITLSGRVLASGNPAQAEVTLYAVDAGMLSVAPYDYPDPEAFFCTRNVRTFALKDARMYDYFNRPKPLLSFMPGFWRGDMLTPGYSLTPTQRVVARSSLVKSVFKKSGRVIGGLMDDLPPWLLEDEYQYCAPAPCVVDGLVTGGLRAGSGEMPGDEQPRLRTNFAPVAVWQGALKTDAEGRFSAEVTLPDTLTTYEVIAVAVDRSGKRFGSARGEFTVAQPVMLTPGTPLFMSLGDELRLPLSIVNNTDEAGTWTVSLEGAAASQEITLEARRSGTLYFDFKALSEGEQKLRWTALGKPGSDAVQGEFSVRFPAPVLKEHHHLILKPGESPLQLAALFGADVAAARRGELELVASANPLLHLAGAADFLLEYPYGCTEQRASGLIPWLLYDELAPFCPQLAKTRREDVKKIVQAAIADLLPRQCEDGGLSFWGGWNHSCLWATAHAGYVLKLAQEQGFDVPQDAMDKLYRYLWWSSTDDESARTRFAIARTRGKTGQMKSILREMLEIDKECESSYLQRETRATVQFMLSMLENPAGADEAFRTWLRTAARDYRHSTTQGNAWNLFALVEYLKLRKEQGSQASLALHDGSVLPLGREATVVSLPWQPGQEMKTLPTTLRAQGGTVYASLRVRALPQTDDFPGVTERGLQVTRVYETRGADGIWRPASEFKVGDVVRVTLTCAKVADEHKYLVLEDYLPACMEAINPAVPSQAAGLEPLHWSLAFDHREYLADRVRGFCTRWEGRDLLNMRYYARVKRAGSSAAPPAQAQLMYEPQVYGLSPNTRITSHP